MAASRTTKWGIIGLGNIARQFASDLALVGDGELVAVASRSQEKALVFAQEFGAKAAYGNYDDILFDAEVDIIYIATPHDSHAELSIKALNAGKPVLCEKPVAINAVQAQRMVDAARANGVFFMEALWTRFNPSIKAALRLVRQGELGQVNFVNAEFAYYVPDPQGRMINMENGGGSLLDMGVYPVFLAYLMLGKPERIQASANFFENGADKQTSMIFHYPQAQAILHSSFMAHSNMIGTIAGTDGRISLHAPWFETQGYSVIKNNHKVDVQLPTTGRGFSHEIDECHRCLAAGKLESDLWSHQNSLDLIEIVDRVRQETGLVYPADQQNETVNN